MGPGIARPLALALALAFAAAAGARGGAAAAAAAEEAVPPPALDADDECALDTGEGCSLSALQRRASGRRALAGEEDKSGHHAESSCHTTKPGEPCYEKVMWAMHDGMATHPEWYPGLTATAGVADFQAVLHAKDALCPLPCGGEPKDKPWCADTVPAKLWTPVTVGPPMTVKILSYNLFWWSLFKLRDGNKNSAGALIKKNMDPEPFDVMGFQECESATRVLEPVGLLGQYAAFVGSHAICVAYNTEKWTLLGHGDADVAEDMPTRYYGKRGTQWLRLEHKNSNKTLFFVNHHGPLAINSGGVCGGASVADHLLGVMGEHAQVGDTLVLVGDFNANAGSLTIQKLWQQLVHVFVGPSWGGVDNIFSNADTTSVIETKVLGDGGSDHDAISATIQVGGELEMRRSAHLFSMPQQGAKEMTGTGKPGYDWQYFWCGLLEEDVEYGFVLGAWNKSAPAGAKAPDWCCRECQAQEKCASWLWKDYSETAKGAECLLSGSQPSGRKPTEGFVSGLAYTAAAEAAARVASLAIARV